MHIVFFSHYQQIPDVGFVASHLREAYGHRCTLWVLGRHDARQGEERGDFDAVVDLLPPAQIYKKADRNRDRNLEWIRDLEDRVGTTFWHQDSAQDRYFQAESSVEIAKRNLPIDWTEEKVAAFTYAVGQSLEDRLSSGDVDALFVEMNSLPYRLCRRLADLYDVPAGYYGQARLWDERGYLEPALGFEWETCREAYRRFEADGIPEELYSRAKNRRSQIRETQEQPNYHETNPSGDVPFTERLRPQRILYNLNYWRRCLREPWSVNPRHLPAHVVSPWGQLKRFWRTRTSQRYYRRVVTRDVDLERPFAVYFLHVQPEMTVEAMAFDYQDQVATIRNLAAGLPAHVPLYVKEHKPMIGRRPVQFYAELAQIPGVTLVDEDIHSHHLIRRAEVVLTLTGTVGLEAILYGVPALALGDVFFNGFEGVYHPQSIDRAQELLGGVSELRGATEEEALRTLAATYEASMPGIYPPRPEERPQLSREGVQTIHECLTRWREL